MPIGFVGPALQGASFIGGLAIPALQSLGIGAATTAVTSNYGKGAFRSARGEGYGEPPRPTRQGPPVPARLRQDPRYTSSGAPIPEKFGQPSGLVGGGNAGATGSAGTGRRTANPASNPPRVTPRAEVQSQALGTAIQQAQGPSFWESNTALKEAAENGPKAGTAGYAQRADIQAWMEAMNKTESGRAMVQRFLDKERQAGRLTSDSAQGPTSDQALLQAQAAGVLDDFKGGSTDDALLYAQQKGFNPAPVAGAAQPKTGLSTDDYLRGAQAAGALDGFKGGSADDAVLAAMGRGYGAAELQSGAQTAYDPRQVLNQPGADRELPTWASSLELGQPVVPKGQAMAAAQQPALEAQMQAFNPEAYTDPLLRDYLGRAGWGY